MMLSTKGDRDCALVESIVASAGEAANILGNFRLDNGGNDEMISSSQLIVM